MTDLQFQSWIETPWLAESGVRLAFTLAYLAMLGLLALYGLHRYWLVWLYWRTRRRAPAAPSALSPRDWPGMTVQLPLFNEGPVTRRIIDAAAALDYPRDRLQIQVLDDSTDDSADLARQRVAHWAQQGLDITVLHRRDRRGYKAGALADAMTQVKGELIAIFDADFVPAAQFLRQVVPHLVARPQVGIAQARWEHLNADHSTLTRCQALFIDGHFAIEQAARNRSGRWIHFNGTAGLWRRAAIDAAGGWSADTLSEDLDLSIRAQLAGWQCLYLQDVTCPAELPPVVPAFKQQQFRWFKGTTQVMRKLLPRVWKSKAPWRAKLEVTLQLLGPWVSPVMVLMALGYLPFTVLHLRAAVPAVAAILLPAMGIVAATVFYAASQLALGRGMWAALVRVPAMMAVGMGIALTNSRATLEAVLRVPSPFVRTPKFTGGAVGVVDDVADLAVRRRFVAVALRWGLPLLEVMMGLYMALCAAVALSNPRWLIATPLPLIFAAGFFWFGIASLADQWQRLRHSKRRPAAASRLASRSALASEPA